MEFDASTGNWFKGNLHTHTSDSDAHWSIEECLDFYQSNEYDFLSITDHWLVTEANGSVAGDMLAIPGIELNGWTTSTVQHHVLGLGVDGVPPRNCASTLESTVSAIRCMNGLPVVAHPEWSGQTARQIKSGGEVGLLEVFNATSEIREGNGIATAQWNELLSSGQQWFALATDDAHMIPGSEDCGKGWVCVQSQELTMDSMLAAISAGRFWSSTGPSLKTFSIDSNSVVVKCSPCKVVECVVDGFSFSRRSTQDLLTRVEFELPEDWTWVRAECHDDTGGTAWTNPSFRVAN